jgi:ribosomal protein L11 methyltransferase
VIRLAIRVQRDQAELVLAELLELAPAGVEENELQSGVVEFAIYGAPGEIPTLPDLRAAAGEALVEVSTTELADDWQERWKRFHEPIMIHSAKPATVPNLWVRAPWQAPCRDIDTREVVIDPGQAFGTGAHATTRLCLQLLGELAASVGARGPLVDLGTGSGVLAIAARMLGFDPVLGLDYDQLAVDATKANAQANCVSVDVRRFDLRRDLLPTAPLLLANLLRPLLLQLAEKLSQPPRHLLASGLLVDEVDEIVGVFGKRHGLCERERRTSGEWAAVWLCAEGE